MNRLPIKPILKTLRRQALWIVAGTFLGLVASWAVLLWLPNMYRAGTMIMVAPQKIPKDYVKSTVTGSIEERLRTIRQQITNRDTMSRVIHELGLYPELQGGAVEQLVRRARNALGLRVTGSSIFTITYKYQDPQLASDAANRIAALFIEENLKLRETQVENTSAFLESELRSTKSQLEAREAEVAEFRLRNEGELPGQRAANLSTITRLETELRITEGEISDAELKRMFLSRLPDRGPEVQDDAPSADEERLREARRELFGLKAQLTSRHPDILRLENEISQLEKNLTAVESPVESPEVVVEELTENPHLLSLDVELRELETKRDEILREIASRQRRLERIPKVEQELLRITRDYDNVEQSYDSLLAKLLDARLSENLEKRQQSERFIVLEEALPPNQPYSPKRGLIFAVGAALGLLLGCGLALLREEISQTLDDVEALKEAFPAVRVLSSIPQFDSSREPRVFWAKVEKRATG